MMKLVVFDLDGTLADTLADLANAVNFALARQNLPTYPVDDYRHFVGNGIDNLIRVTMADAYTPEGAVRAKADFQTYYADHCTDCTVAYDGIATLLDRLDADHTATAVISNKPDRFVPEILAKLYPCHTFLSAWGQRDEFPRKPSPESLEALIARSGYQKSDTLYVGDSNVDVVFAHNAGVKVCGVSWGFRGAKELREAGADHIVNSAEELYSLVNGE
ncbi:HAD family hydrolase [Ruminococcus sp.]|uniref:HAD family hydrolase n=1 Tax=Ruminococcus sp. TaxID=41978 RepID=UPI002E7FBAB1|nr:HAD hydrolase-like protein [Ruminococcus sp.]MEE3492464.1 HAD hydrolase-like protein [Ruminococcus sp.]